MQTLNRFHVSETDMSSETDNSAPIDRISNLPDELICHILSFLPTRQAFATKRLSKRWALLCYSLSVLSFLFDDGTVQDDDDGTILDDDDETVLDDDYSIAIYWFCHFVDTLVLSPSAINKSINTFSLTFISRSYDVDNQRFHAWVEAAKQRHVKEFHLFMNNVTLNPTIFTSQTLVVLKLERLKVEAETLIVDFPSLKTLHLRFVRFQNKNDFMKLLNACPILEDLHTSHPRYVENNEVEEFKTLFLSKLVRADIGPIDVPFNAISKVEFLRIDYEQKATLTSIPVFRNLIHIELLFYHFFLGWDSVIELLQLCPKLQILYLKKVCGLICSSFTCSFLIYILMNVILCPFDSGVPDYPKIGKAQFHLLNAFRLTSDHVLF